MGESLVGAGGWGYFAGGLDAYARAFAFAEVNATFYRRVPEALARRWRARAPAGFVFSVRAHRDVTHRDGLRASGPAREAFAHDVRIARTLRAPFLILEIPSSRPVEGAQVAGLRDLSAIADRGVRIGLEARAYRGESLPPALGRALQDLAILDVVDLSQTRPRVADETVYSRLFGPGPHNVYEFDDDELRSIDRAGSDALRVAFTFHGVRMYKDAARFLSFKRTGQFPSATASRGLASLEEVLRPDARFPATRADLLRDHGWKVVDLDDATRAHATRFLERLPARTFESLPDLIRSFGAGSAVLPGGPNPSGPADFPASGRLKIL